MLVKDFPVDFNSLYNCCSDHIYGNDTPVYKGMKITCQDCGKVMVLRNVNGKKMWTEK
jgi:hypothetical protein